jgi:hypothetical protein
VTLANGSAILASDLDGITESARALLRTDAQRVPLGLALNFHFQGLTAALYGTNPERFRSVFITPWDCWVETIAVRTGEFTAASTISATITGPTDSEGEEISITAAFPLVVPAGTVGANTTRLSRLLYDGTATRAGAGYMQSNRASRLLLAGMTYTLQLAVTGNAVANSMAQVCLLLRQAWARAR